jgi:uncharacterized protein (DUF1697 family)
MTTKTYIALLRAINVGGSSVMTMADLKAQFEAMGFANVRTYIQSGNVLFEAPEESTSRLAERAEQQLRAGLGYAGRVFVLTPQQLADAAANNPFDPEASDGAMRCHIMVLSREPEPERIDKLTAQQAPEYRFAVRGSVLYYTYAKEYAGKRRTIDFEGILGTEGTARTWKVVRKLVELAGHASPC